MSTRWRGREKHVRNSKFPSVPPFRTLHMLIYMEVLWALSFSLFIDISLCRHECLSHSSLIIDLNFSFSTLWMLRTRVWSSISLSRWLFFPVTNPYCEASQRLSAIYQIVSLKRFIPLNIPRSFFLNLLGKESRKKRWRPNTLKISFHSHLMAFT
jgi:hypothetical protein